MALLRIERVNVLPGTLTANTMYIVKGSAADLADVYFVGSNVAEVRHIVSKSEIETMIASSVGGLQNIELVADIAARDALAAGATRNLLVLVADATGDATVESGAATYIYTVSNTTWTKIGEYESLDVTLQWANLQGKPTSSVTDIDSAVAQMHTHANAAQLDKVGEDAQGKLTYNGANPEAALAVVEW